MATNNAINLNSAGVTYYNGTGTFTGVVSAVAAGIPMISNGSGVAPVYGTAIVAGGGTGAVMVK